MPAVGFEAIIVAFRDPERPGTGRSVKRIQGKETGFRKLEKLAGQGRKGAVSPPGKIVSAYHPCPWCSRSPTATPRNGDYHLGRAGGNKESASSQQQAIALHKVSTDSHLLNMTVYKV